MAITLQNFGVPLGDGQVRGGILMPKLKNRFRVFVYGFGIAQVTTDFTRQVISAGRPNFSFDPQEIHAYNSVAYYAGKHKFETVTVTVRDDASNAVTRLVQQQLQRQMNFYAQTTPLAAGDYKFSMLVQALDGGGTPAEDAVALETWSYEGCFIASANYESYDYSSSDAMTIEMAIRFDNVTSDLMPDITYGGSTFLAT